MGAPVNLLPQVVSSGIGALGSLASTFLNQSLNRESMYDQIKLSKELMDYQWEKFQSPEAYVKSLAAAGVNPAAAFGEGKYSVSSPSVSMPSSTPATISGISDISSFVKALAEAKKAGIDVKDVEQDIKNKQLQNDREAFELRLRKEFGLKESAANLALAEENVKLAIQSGKKNELDLAIGQWIKAKEKAISEAEESRRDILKKELENTDKRLNLENTLLSEKAKTERSQQSANFASAKASTSQAALNESNKKYQDIVNDIKESGKTFELENLIRNWQAENKVADATAEQAYTMLSRYRQLNENDKNAAARYINYLFWFLKEQMPNLPVVPFLNVGK